MTDPTDPPPVPLEYATPQPRRRSWKLWVLVTSLLLGVVLLVLILQPATNTGGYSPRAACESNMHQIGLAILLYQQD